MTRISGYFQMYTLESNQDILWLWLAEDIRDCTKNTSEMCRMGMLSKLKYVGVPIEDLIKIYCSLFIQHQSTAQLFLQPH